MCIFSHKSEFEKTFEKFLKLLSKKKLDKKICKKLFSLNKSMIVYIPFCFMDYNMWHYYIDLIKINHKISRSKLKIIDNFTEQIKLNKFEETTLKNIICIQPEWIGIIPDKLITYEMWLEYFKNHKWQTYPETIEFINKHSKLTQLDIINFKDDYITLSNVPNKYRTEELCWYALKTHKDIEHNVNGLPKELIHIFANYILNSSINYEIKHKVNKYIKKN